MELDATFLCDSVAAA